jgi:putative membrane protein
VTGAPDGAVDRGLQAERTALAWRRTSLALAVAAAGAGRLAAPALGALALALAGLGLLQAVAVGWRAARRYRTVRRALGSGGDPSAVRAGGLPIAALAVSGAVTGLLALAFVLDPRS